jgi:hypothetical protein
LTHTAVWRRWAYDLTRTTLAVAENNLRNIPDDTQSVKSQHYTVDVSHLNFANDFIFIHLCEAFNYGFCEDVAEVYRDA